MAAPVRIEATAFSDPRIDLLGQLAGYSRFEALGRLAHLWSTCTERQLYVVPEAIIRATIGPAGVQHMLDADLAVPDEGGYRIRGLAGRIEWHGELREKRARAGRARAERVNRDTAGRMLADNRPAHAGQVLSKTPAPASTDSAQSSASTNTSTSTLISASNENREDLEHTAQRGGPGERAATRASLVSALVKSGKRKLDPTPAERDAAMYVLRKLGEASGVAYRGCDEHVRLIVARFREGLDRFDLSAVVAYCASPVSAGGKGWEADPRMRQYLRPSTLFGPDKIHDYLDAARTFARDELAQARRAEQAVPLQLIPGGA